MVRLVTGLFSAMTKQPFLGCLRNFCSISRLFLSCLFLLTSISARAGEPLIQQLESLVSGLPQGSVYSIQVRDPASGNVLFEKGASRNLVPASVLKVLTATTAYDALGHDFRYHTRIQAQRLPSTRGVIKGAVMLSFSGDPSLKHKDLEELILQLKRKGVASIAGDFWLNGEVFSGYDRAGGVSWDDLNVCFAAPAAAMILDRNCFYAWLKPAGKDGELAIIEYDEPDWQLAVDNRIRTRKLDEGEKCAQEVRASSEYEYRLDGCITADSWPLRLAFSVNNVERAVERYLKALLKRHNIRLKGRVIVGRPDMNFPRVLAEHQSEKLPKLLKPVLSDSDNLYSDSILKTVAYQKSGKPGSFASGIESARELLGDKGVGFGSSRLVDGSGLSRYNFISASTLVDVLMVAWSEWGEASPWLNERDRKEQWFKTGYMSGVSSMAGYVFPEKGRPLVFAVILNGLMPPLPASREEMQAFRKEIRGFHRSFLNVLNNKGLPENKSRTSLPAPATISRAPKG